MTTPIRPSLAQLLNAPSSRRQPTVTGNMGSAASPAGQSPAFGSLMERIARESRASGQPAITETLASQPPSNPTMAPATFKGAAIKQSLDQAIPTRLMAPGSFLNIRV
jgi:hypothetical protein